MKFRIVGYPCIVRLVLVNFTVMNFTVVMQAETISNLDSSKVHL